LHSLFIALYFFLPCQVDAITLASVNRHLPLLPDTHSLTRYSFFRSLHYLTLPYQGVDVAAYVHVIGSRSAHAGADFIAPPFATKVTFAHADADDKLALKHRDVRVLLPLRVSSRDNDATFFVIVDNTPCYNAWWRRGDKRALPLRLANADTDGSGTGGIATADGAAAAAAAAAAGAAAAGGGEGVFDGDGAQASDLWSTCDRFATRLEKDHIVRQTNATATLAERETMVRIGDKSGFYIRNSNGRCSVSFLYVSSCIVFMHPILISLFSLLYTYTYTATLQYDEPLHDSRAFALAYSLQQTRVTIRAGRHCVNGIRVNASRIVCT
jgi:hypothetical protein